MTAELVDRNYDCADLDEKLHQISGVRQILRVLAQKLDMARLPWDVEVLTI
jgi:hypothetical protein